MKRKLSLSAIAAVTFLSVLFTGCEQPINEVINQSELYVQIPAPEDVRVNVKDNGIVLLTWEPVANAESYSVYRREFEENRESFKQNEETDDQRSEDGKTEFVLIDTSDDSEYEDVKSTDNNLENKKYEYAIRTHFDANRPGNKYVHDSELSKAITANLTKVTFPARGTQLPVPANVMMKQAGSEVTIFWDKVDYADGYEVYQIDIDKYPGYEQGLKNQYLGTPYKVEEAKLFQEINLLVETETGSGIYKADNKSYVFVVRAVCANNYYFNSELSAVTEETTRIPTDVNVNFASAPTVTGFGDRIQVEWSKVTGADSYEVYRSVNGGDFIVIPGASLEYVRVKDTLTSYDKYMYEDTTAKADTAYRYKIQPKKGFDVADINACVESLEVYTVESQKVYTAPTSVTATEGKFDDKIVVTWSKVEKATGYIIYRRDNGVEFKTKEYVELVTVGNANVYQGTAENTLFYEDMKTNSDPNKNLLPGEGTTEITYTYKVAALFDGNIRSRISEAEAKGHIANNTYVTNRSLSPVTLEIVPTSADLTLEWNHTVGSKTTNEMTNTVTEVLEPTSYTIYMAREPKNVDYDNIDEYPELIEVFSGLTSTTNGLNVSVNNRYSYSIQGEITAKNGTVIEIVKGEEYLFAIRAVYQDSETFIRSEESQIKRTILTDLPQPKIQAPVQSPASNDNTITVTMSPGDDIVAPEDAVYKICWSATNPAESVTDIWSSNASVNYNFNDMLAGKDIVSSGVTNDTVYVWVMASSKGKVSYSSPRAVTLN